MRSVLAVQQIVRRITRSQVDAWLLVGVAVGLLGCPLLLDDDYSIAPFALPDAGEPCIGSTCHVPYSNIGGSSGGEEGDSGGDSGSAGAAAAGAGGSSEAGGSSGAAGAAAGSAGSSGSAGAAGQAGSSSGGSAGSGSAGSAGAGSAGTGGGENACWTLELTDGTHDASSNCLGIAGNNVRVTDTGTTLTLSYEDGDPCFTGTIAASPDWGATFELDLAPSGSSWSADAAGVTGFEFAYRGSQQPASARAIYKMKDSASDFCRTIGAGTTAVPFSAAHPSCSTSSSTVVDSTKLETLILAILPQPQSYAVDFCVQIRALD